MDKRRQSDPRKNTPKPDPEKKTYNQPRKLLNRNDERSLDTPNTTSQTSALPTQSSEREERFRVAAPSQPQQSKRKSTNKFEETGEPTQTTSLLDSGPTKTVKPISGKDAARNPVAIVPLRWLKSGDGKVVMLARVDGKQRVLKLVTTDQGSLLEANVLATAWIRVLNRPCLHAPQMTWLAPQAVFKALRSWGAFVKEHAPGALNDLRRLLQPRANETAADELRVIGTSGESAPGFPVDKLLDANLAGAFDELTHSPLVELQILLARRAWTDTRDAERRTSKILELCQQGKLDECFKYLNGLKAHAPTEAQHVLQRGKFILKELGCAPAQEFVLANMPLAKPEAALKAWLAKPEGTQAFVELACIDLVLGMDDRIVGVRPGLQNVLFHDDVLWCIDNAKYGPFLTTSDTDLAQYKTTTANWKVLDCVQLDVNLYKFLMKTGLWDAGNLKLSVKLVATTLTEVLLRFEHQTKVLAAQAPGAPQLLQRVEYLRARLEDERKLWPQAEASLAGALKSAPPGPIVPLSLMAKTERKLVNLGSDDIKLIHSGKKLMRKAKALEVLKSALPELRANIAGLESDLKDDAALQKAKLELAAATFAVNVHEVAEFIFSAVFVPSPVELNYLNAVAHAWLANPSTSMKQQISEAQTELNDAVASLQADDA